MKVALKLVALLLIGETLVLALGAYLAVQRERDLFVSDMAQDARLFGQTVNSILQQVRQGGSDVRSAQLISELGRNRGPMHIRWVSLQTRVSDSSPIVPIDRLASVADGQSVSVLGEDSVGQRFLFTYIPVNDSGSSRAALEISESLEPMSAYIRTTILRTIILSVAMIFISAALVVAAGYLIIGRKLHLVTQYARSVGRGDLSRRIQIPGHDELAELGGVMNTMSSQLEESQEKLRQETTARISALVQLRHEDRLRTVGRLASGLAHELGTPLNVVSGRAGLIAVGAMNPVEIKESAGIIRSQADRMATLIRDLLAFARRGSDQREPVDMRQIISQTISLLRPLAAKRQAVLNVILPAEPVPARVNQSQIQQVVINLLTNAIQAVEPNGMVNIALSTARFTGTVNSGSPHEHARVEITDDGCGISEEHLSQIFEPFFTTKDIGEGTGLGLPIAYGIIHEHGGWIDVQSELGKGSRFTINIPTGA